MSDDPFRLDGRWAMVTGCSRGLGRAIAHSLARAGASIVGVSSAIEKSQDDIRRELEGFDVDFKAVQCDLGNRESVRNLIARLGSLPELDILINNAGIIRRAPVLEHSETDWYDVLDVNLNAPFFLAQAVGGRMVRRGQGKIIFTASLLSFQGGITIPGYTASKGAIKQLVMLLSNELAESGICVNAIAPGYMETDATRALREDPSRSKAILDRIPAGRWGKPEDIGGTAVFLASSAADYITGTTLVVDGGWLGR